MTVELFRRAASREPNSFSHSSGDDLVLWIGLGGIFERVVKQKNGLSENDMKGRRIYEKYIVSR